MSSRALGPQFPEIPPPPGESPLPEGHDRYFHQTDPSNVPSIKDGGLLWDKGRGVEGPKGVWVSSEPFYKADDLAMVEMALPHHPDRGSVASIGDVPPDRFLAVHEPWHRHARSIEANPDRLRATLAGAYDHVMTDPSYSDAERAEFGPAIDYIKQKYGGGT